MRASLLAGGLAAAALALAADAAKADYTAETEGSTLRITGDGEGDKLALYFESGAPGTLHADVGEDGTIDFSFDRATFDAIVVAARGGDDAVHVGGASTGDAITLDGGAGDDTLIGGSGVETLIGGSGDDLVDGNFGADTALLGSGNDRFNWDPGDTSDIVDGQGGTDVLDFNGSNIAEVYDVSANGTRVRFTRNVASVTMDLVGIDRIALRTLGGTDAVTVNDVTGTELDDVDVDVGGDGQPDTVTARATEGPDTMQAVGAAITGVGADTRITGADLTGDALVAALLGGHDTFNAGTGTSSSARFVVDGGDGFDATNYTGTLADDQIAVVANGAAARVSSPPAAELDVIAEHINVMGGRGADRITATGNLAALTAITMDGGSGDDTLSGSNGEDVLIGGSGNDAVDGQQGGDGAFLGSGSDTFTWDPGDGSDTVEGQSGADALAFNGSNIGEIFEISANGPRVRFARNIANIAMDLDGIERIAPLARGGTDTAIVNDLAGTAVDLVEVDLGLDAQPDSVIARGTEAADAMKVGATGVTGVGARTTITGADAAGDMLTAAALGGDDTITTGIGVPGPATMAIDGGLGTDTASYQGTAADDQIAVVANGSSVRVSSPPTAETDVVAEKLSVVGGSGADTISATGNLAALTALTFDGGAGNDRLLGGNGADTLTAGSGDDFVDGQQGSDVASLGSGADTFNWDPGDGSDTVEGDGGADALAFNGSNIGEILELSANSARVRFTRNVANIAMDLDGVERLALRSLGGADSVTIGDMTGTHLDVADIDVGAADLIQDTVVVNGTAQADNVKVTRAGDQVVTTGLRTLTRIAGSEALNDTLRLQTLAGDDRVTVDPDAELLINPVIDLGADE